MDEYLRRLSMAKIDFDFLMSDLRRRFPLERFLVVHYGDHHPMATRTLLGFDADTEAEDVALSPDSIGFVTYYAVRGINYRVPALPQFETLDVPYLGTVILDMAGLPLSDSHRERKRLMLLCKGLYQACKQRDEILVFHRRLIDFGRDGGPLTPGSGVAAAERPPIYASPALPCRCARGKDGIRRLACCAPAREVL